MSDPLIRELDHYVILEPNNDEKFFNHQETLEWIEGWLKKMDQLPKDLENKKSLHCASQYLLDTACDLEIEPGFRIEWFAIRLTPPKY